MTATVMIHPMKVLALERQIHGITASGTKARRGVVVVDPRVIPLGTRLYGKSLDGTKDNELLCS